MNKVEVKKIAIKVCADVKEEILKILRSEVEIIIRHEIEGFKQSRVNRTDWCCENMRKFAAKVWNINKPHSTDDGFMVGYAYRNIPIIYCPFCGVKL